MEHDTLYVFLASNASLEIHPENTLANFKTRLSKAIHFPHGTEWEVGIKEISFTKSWYTLNFDQKIRFLRVVQDQKGNFTKSLTPVQTTLKPGHYTSSRELVDELNKTLAVKEWDGKITLDEKKQTIAIVPNGIHTAHPDNGKLLLQKVSYPLFSEELLEFLGLYSAYKSKFGDGMEIRMGKRVRKDISSLADFGSLLFYYSHQDKISPLHNDRKNLVTHFQKNNAPSALDIVNPISFEEAALNEYTVSATDPLTIEGTEPINLLAECHSIYVYTDIVESTRVGDSYTQLFNVVTVPLGYGFGDQVAKSYDRPYFHKVSKSYFEEIEIDIKDDSGASVPFRFGRVSIALEFRRRK